MTQRIIVAALILAAAFWLAPRLFPVPKPTPARADSLARADSARRAPAAAPTPNANAAATPAAATPTAATPAAAPQAAAATPAPVATAETLSVGDRLTSTMRFSTAGASLVDATLHRYQTLAPGRSGDIALARPGESLLDFALLLGRDTVRLDRIPFAVARGGSTTRPELVFTGATPAGSATIRYAVVPDSYTVHVAGSVAGAPQGAVLLVQMPQGLRSSEADSADDARHLAIAYKRRPDDARGVSFGSLDAGEVQSVRAPLAWAVTKSKYFLVAVAAPDSARSFGTLSIVGGARTTKLATHALATLEVPLRNGEFAMDVYAGPQEFRRLRALGRDLDTANPYGGFLQGIVQPFATLVMHMLLWMHDTLRLGWGWVLMLVAILVRLVTWPLNQSAMRASLRMQRIQPELQALQKRYKDDPQRFQQEMMKLYKAHGMSPFSSLAGCMPMLIPMPVLFALFFVFQNTIEFRGVPFAWIPDISLHDPYYILPVVMGISMFALSWIGLRNAPPNPQAKTMAYVMPVVMTAIFFRFPAGLNLYYTVQNLVTLPQQWLLTRERAKMASMTPTVQGAPAKARRG